MTVRIRKLTFQLPFVKVFQEKICELKFPLYYLISVFCSSRPFGDDPTSGNSQKKERAIIRPIKLVFQSAFHCDMLMKRLKNLKGKTKYQGISVNEDPTIFERKIVREWSNKAKEINNKEPIDSKFVWRVRGSPSREFYLKKSERPKINRQKDNTN